jgi:hypothetical protein
MTVGRWLHLDEVQIIFKNGKLITPQQTDSQHSTFSIHHNFKAHSGNGQQQSANGFSKTPYFCGQINDCNGR